MLTIFMVYRLIRLNIKVKAFKIIAKKDNSKALGNENNTGVGNRKIARLNLKIKRAKILLIVSFIIDLLIVVWIITTISSFMSTMTTIANITNIIDETVATDNSDSNDLNWSWVTDGGNGNLASSSGIYPKDPALKQLTMFLDISDKSALAVNETFGGSLVNPSVILSVTIRETGGKIINKIVTDTSINLYNDLIYDNPACGKGSACKYILNKHSHFEGGVVINGVDNGNPAINPPSTNLEHYRNSGGDHALGYFQFENNSINGLFKTVFPIGDYIDKEYDESTDKYATDSTLGFIRPNIAYTPDNIITVAYHNGDINRYGEGLKKTWDDIQSKSWYRGLPLKDQQFCWSALKDMSYQSGSNIAYEATTSMRALLELIATMKYDGYIESMYDIVPYIESYYDAANGVMNNIYNRETRKISRPSDTLWTYGFNKIMGDGSLKENTKTAASKLKSTLNGGKFKTYAEAGNRSLYADIPPKSVAYISMGQIVYEMMRVDIESAEKEQGSGFNIVHPVGVSKENFKITPGTGQGTWEGKSTADLVSKDNKFYKETKHMWGTSVTLSEQDDPFNSINSKFHVPYFSQISSIKKEAWGKYNTGNFNLQDSGCAVYMWAHIASALQQRLINPPEMLTLGYHYGAFDSKGLFTWEEENHKKIFASFGYSLTMYTKTQSKQDSTWEKLNDALRKNIPSGFRASSEFTTTGSHFLCIDGITDDGKYILAQTNYVSKEKKVWTRAELYNSMHSSNKCLYIVDKY